MGEHKLKKDRPPVALGQEVAIIPHGDGALAHLRGLLHDARVTCILALTKGMTSGRPSVAVVLEDGHGHAFLGQVSLRVFLEAADQLKIAHGDPREEDPIEVRRENMPEPGKA